VAARRDATATALTVAALEALRAGPRIAGSDTTARDAVVYVRRWTATPGRGHPDTLGATVTWPGHDIDVTSEVAP